MTKPNPDNLDEWFPRDERGDVLAAKTNGNPNQVYRLGVVVGGSISRGLALKLEPNVSVEDLAVGRYVSNALRSSSAVTSPYGRLAPIMTPEPVSTTRLPLRYCSS